MDIIKFALAMEEDGEELYEKLAKESKSIGLRKIFQLMADEEKNHIMVIKEFSSASAVTFPVPSAITPNNIFKELIEENSSFFVTKNEVELYRRCLEMEEKSRDFYSERIDKAVSTQEKEVLCFLAAEEQKHVELLENIIEHISYSDSHVDDADFSHQDE